MPHREEVPDMRNGVMEIEEYEREKACVIALKGRFASIYASDAKDTLERILYLDPWLLVMDLSDLQSVSNQGLRVIYRFLRKASELGKRVHLARASLAILELFDACGILGLFHYYPTLEEAIENGQPQKA